MAPLIIAVDSGLNTDRLVKLILGLGKIGAFHVDHPHRRVSWSEVCVNLRRHLKIPQRGVRLVQDLMRASTFEVSLCMLRPNLDGPRELADCILIVPRIHQRHALVESLAGPLFRRRYVLVDARARSDGDQCRECSSKQTALAAIEALTRNRGRWSYRVPQLRPKRFFDAALLLGHDRRLYQPVSPPRRGCCAGRESEPRLC